MRSFVRNRYESGEMQYDERMLPTIHSLQELLDYVKEKHEYYVHDRGNVNLDCAYSYIVCLEKEDIVCELEQKFTEK